MTTTTPPGTNLSQRQIMLSFAFLAYSGELITNLPKQTVEKKILDLINTAMPKIPPIATTDSPPKAAWEVVWGPATFTFPGGLYQDRMMFVVQHKSDPSQFVVAIRGTNGRSMADWLLDDLDLGQMMPWPPGATGTEVVGQISESTSIDLQTSLTLTSDNGLTLVDFLKQSITGPASVCVTGHSKGGAMSSTMALYLKECQSSWDPGGKAIVSNVSFAGPTAGDAKFAAYSDKQFANPAAYPPGWDATLGSSCDACRNSLDVATLAWDDNNYKAIVDLYKPNISLGSLTWYAINSTVKKLFQALLGKQHYRQIKYGQEIVPGQFSGTRSGRFSSFKTRVMDYAREGGLQHHAYPDLLGVPQLADDTIIVSGGPIILRPAKPD